MRVGHFPFFFGIDRALYDMVFFLESGPRAMEPGLVLDLCPVFGTCVRACPVGISPSSFLKAGN